MPTHSSSQKHQSYERARAMVEFAVALPILIFRFCAAIREVPRRAAFLMSLSESSYPVFFVVSSYSQAISPKSPVQINLGNKWYTLPSCPRKVDLMIHAIIFLFFSLLFGMRRPWDEIWSHNLAVWV